MVDFFANTSRNLFDARASKTLFSINQALPIYQFDFEEKQMFLESETENNREMDKKIAGEERNAAKFRIDLQEHENTRSQLQDEVRT